MGLIEAKQIDDGIQKIKILSFLSFGLRECRLFVGVMVVS
jgi:hypothetical protein